MKKDKKNPKIILMNKLGSFTMFIGIFGVFAATTTVSAQGYVPLEPLPNLPSGPVEFGTYLDVIFKLGLGVAIVLAVIVLVIAGIEYIGGASNESARTDAKERIWGAILGLLIALGAWLILYTINPDINSSTLDPLPVTQQQIGSGGSGSGGGAGGGQYCIDYFDLDSDGDRILPQNTDCFTSMPACSAQETAWDNSDDYYVETGCYSS